jgi:hypothetical protein
MSKNIDKCPGCQRLEVHKMCPAWGTPLYMSGVLFTKEHEKQYAELRKKVIQKNLENNYESC